MAPRTTSNTSQVSNKMLPLISLPMNQTLPNAALTLTLPSFFLFSGGGDVKIDSHKPNIKAKSKIGSMDNVGGGNGQTNGHKV